MVSKRKNLYLYLTLACFVAIIGIFIVDGYMGIYDTIRITIGVHEQEIEPDHWLRVNRVWTGAKWGEKVLFSYEVDNRRFSSYAADIEVSVWFRHEKVGDLISQRMSIDAYHKGCMEWVMDTTELFPTPPEQGQWYDSIVIIKRGEIEWKIHVHIRNPA